MPDQDKNTRDEVNTRSGRKGDPVSLAPLTPNEALAAALRVKREDMDKLDEKGKAKKKRAKGKK